MPTVTLPRPLRDAVLTTLADAWADADPAKAALVERLATAEHLGTGRRSRYRAALDTPAAALLQRVLGVLMRRQAAPPGLRRSAEAAEFRLACRRSPAA